MAGMEAAHGRRMTPQSLVANALELVGEYRAGLYL